jgi:hypothetical protein
VLSNSEELPATPIKGEDVYQIVAIVQEVILNNKASSLFDGIRRE